MGSTDHLRVRYHGDLLFEVTFLDDRSLEQRAEIRKENC